MVSGRCLILRNSIFIIKVKKVKNVKESKERSSPQHALMLGEILRGLDIVHRGLVLLDVAAVGPGVDELHDVAITPLGTVYCTEVLLAEAVGQQIEHVLRTTHCRELLAEVLLAHLFAIEMQLAPEVVLLTPTAEVGNIFCPLIAMGDEEEYGLVVGNAVGAIRERLEDIIVRQFCQVGILLHDALCHLLRLSAFDEPSGGIEVVDEGLQLSPELLVIVAKTGDSASAKRTDNGARRFFTIGRVNDLPSPGFPTTTT